MFCNRFFIRCLSALVLSLTTVAVQAEDSLESDNTCVTLRSREDGMFSVFFDVMSLLQCYERGTFSYVEVDFADTGPYYDENVGPNWWEYYFQPIRLGDKTQMPNIILGNLKEIKPFDIEFKTPRQEVNKLIQTYVSIKPAIQEEIDAFVNDHFQSSFVIGIHYRGTDKKCEARRLSYVKVSKQIRQTINRLKIRYYKIFVATDEQAFLDYMISHFRDRVCWIKETKRSIDNTALHYSNIDSPYMIGKHALMDCILLSKTHILLRTSSNLSLASTFFNPDLEVIELSKRW